MADDHDQDLERPTRPRSRQRLALAAQEIDQEDALTAEELSFYARIFIFCGMPHSEPGPGPFERSNGLVTLAMIPHPKAGLPYGKLPRLLLAWATTEALLTNSPELELGASLSAFMRDLGLGVTGGRWGTVSRLRDQMKRLFSASISCYREQKQGDAELWDETGFRVADRVHLWWSAREPDQAALYGSSVTLNRTFFEMIRDKPVPVDHRVLRALRSPLSIDLYFWASWRSSYITEATRPIPWARLARQFGSNYAELRFFKRQFLAAARDVLKLYPALRLEEHERGLIVRPGSPHVAKRTLG